MISLTSKRPKFLHYYRKVTDDDAFGKGSIAANGRGAFPAYLFQVKTEEESQGPWDVYKLVSTTPAQEALMPPDQSGCKLSQS